jgi:Sec-independent protein translocase protein TatA
MPNLGVTELVILLAILLALFGVTKLPQISAWLAELWPESPDSSRRKRSGWSLSDWLLVASVIVLVGVAAVLFADSSLPHLARPH